MEDTSYHKYSFCGLDDAHSNKDNSSFRILPIPYEATTSYGLGTRFGPSAILDASLNMETYDEELLCETYKAGIHTLPPIPPEALGPEQMNKKITEISMREIDKNSILISLGGEHSISPGLVNAFITKYPSLSVLHLDAHADLRDTYQGSPFSHACAAKRFIEKTKIVSAGIRSLSAEEAYLIKSKGLDVFFGKEALDKTEEITSLLSDDVYISLDIDILDPSIMPSTGTPEPNGWLWHELTSFLKSIIMAKNIVGMDMVELSPSRNNPAPDFTATKLLYRIMGYIANSKGWL